MGGVPEWPKGSDCKSDAKASVVRIHPPPPYPGGGKASIWARLDDSGYMMVDWLPLAGLPCFLSTLLSSKRLVCRSLVCRVIDKESQVTGLPAYSAGIVQW